MCRYYGCKQRSMDGSDYCRFHNRIYEILKEKLEKSIKLDYEKKMKKVDKLVYEYMLRHTNESLAKECNLNYVNLKV